MPKRYPPEFCRRVLDLVATGRSVASVADDLGVSAQTIYNWRRQDAVDRGEAAGLTTAEQSELRAARRRIAQLEDELAVIRRANELLKAQVVSPKTVRGDLGDRVRGSPGPDRSSRVGGLRIRLLWVAEAATVGSADPPRLTD